MTRFSQCILKRSLRSFFTISSDLKKRNDVQSQTNFPGSARGCPRGDTGSELPGMMEVGIAGLKPMQPKRFWLW